MGEVVRREETLSKVVAKGMSHWRKKVEFGWLFPFYKYSSLFFSFTKNHRHKLPSPVLVVHDEPPVTTAASPYGGLVVV